MRVLTCSLLSLLWVNDARADFYTHRWQDRTTRSGTLTLSPEFNYNSTRTNFDSSATSAAVSGLDSYSRTNLDLTLSYGLFEPFSIFYRTNWGYNRIAHTTLSSSAYGFGDQSVGLNVQILSWKTNYSLDLQAQFDFPAYDNTANQNQSLPLLGDGSMDFTAGAFLAIPIFVRADAKFMVTAGAGYTFRNLGFSSAIPWSADLTFEPVSSGLGFTASAYGNWSLRTDGGTRNTTGSGGSFIVNAVNPSYLAVRGALSYRFSPATVVHAALANTVWGVNAPGLLAFTLGAQWDLNSTTPRQVQTALTPTPKGFTPYALDAKINRVNDRLNLVRIDRGSDQGVQKGETLDIFSVKPDGSILEVVARAEVISVKSDEAALRITQYFREVWIEDGFAVKRPLK